MPPTIIEELVGSLKESTTLHINVYNKLQNEIEQGATITDKVQKELIGTVKLHIATDDEELRKAALETWVLLLKEKKSLDDDFINMIYNGDSSINECVISLYSYLIKENCLELEKLLLTTDSKDIRHKILESVNQSSANIPHDIFFNFILENVVNSIFKTNDNNLRMQLIEFTLSTKEKYPIPDKQHKNIGLLFKTRYLLDIEVLRHENNMNWYELCIFTLKYCGTLLHHEIELTNSILHNIEIGFKTRTVQDRLMSYECWKALIDNCSLDHNYLRNNKQLKLLVKPLKLKLSKHESVIVKRFIVWTHLIQALQQEAIVCLGDFIQYCYGPINSNTIDSLVPITSTAIINTWQKRTEILMKFIGHYGHINSCIHSSNMVFDKPIICSSNFIEFDYLIINCLRVCCERLHLWENKCSRAKIVKCLWGSLFHIIQNLAEAHKENVLHKVFLQINYLLNKSYMRNDYFEDLIKNILEVLSSFQEPICDIFLNQIIIFPLLKSMISYTDLNQERIDVAMNLTKYGAKLMNNLDYFNYACVFFNSFEHEKSEYKLSFELWLHLADVLYIICKSPKDSYDDFEMNAKFLMSWIFKYIYPSKLSDKIMDKWKDIILELNAITSSSKEHLLKEYEKVIKDNPNLIPNVTAFLPLFSQLVTEEKFNKAYVLTLASTITECVKHPCVSNKNVTFLIPVVKKCTDFILKLDKTDIESVSEKLMYCFMQLLDLHQAYEILNNMKIYFSKIPENIKQKVPSSLLNVVDGLVNNTDLAVSNDARLVLEQLKKQTKPECCSFVQPVLSSRTARIANMVKRNTCDTNTLKLFGHDIDSKSSVCLKDNRMNNTPSARSKKTINAKSRFVNNIKSIDDDDSKNFVFIDKEVTFDKTKMNEHQIEVLKKRRENIPALYQDLSQSQHSNTMDSSMDRSVSGEKAFEKIIDSIRKSNGTSEKELNTVCIKLSPIHNNLNLCVDNDVESNSYISDKSIIKETKLIELESHIGYTDRNDQNDINFIKNKLTYDHTDKSKILKDDKNCLLKNITDSEEIFKRPSQEHLDDSSFSLNDQDADTSVENKTVPHYAHNSNINETDTLKKKEKDVTFPQNETEIDLNKHINACSQNGKHLEEKDCIKTDDVIPYSQKTDIYLPSDKHLQKTNCDLSLVSLILPNMYTESTQSTSDTNIIESKINVTLQKSVLILDDHLMQSKDINSVLTEHNYLSQSTNDEDVVKYDLEGNTDLMPNTVLETDRKKDSNCTKQRRSQRIMQYIQEDQIPQEKHTENESSVNTKQMERRKRRRSDIKLQLSKSGSSPETKKRKKNTLNNEQLIECVNKLTQNLTKKGLKRNKKVNKEMLDDINEFGKKLNSVDHNADHSLSDNNGTKTSLCVSPEMKNINNIKNKNQENSSNTCKVDIDDKMLTEENISPRSRKYKSKIEDNIDHNTLTEEKISPRSRKYSTKVKDKDHNALTEEKLTPRSKKYISKFEDNVDLNVSTEGKISPQPKKFSQIEDKDYNMLGNKKMSPRSRKYKCDAIQNSEQLLLQNNDLIANINSISTYTQPKQCTEDDLEDSTLKNDNYTNVEEKRIEGLNSESTKKVKKCFKIIPLSKKEKSESPEKIKLRISISSEEETCDLSLGDHPESDIIRQLEAEIININKNLQTDVESTIQITSNHVINNEVQSESWQNDEALKPHVENNQINENLDKSKEPNIHDMKDLPSNSDLFSKNASENKFDENNITANELIINTDNQEFSDATKRDNESSGDESQTKDALRKEVHTISSRFDECDSNSSDTFSSKKLKNELRRIQMNIVGAETFVSRPSRKRSSYNRKSYNQVRPRKANKLKTKSADENTKGNINSTQEELGNVQITTDILLEKKSVKNDTSPANDNPLKVLTIKDIIEDTNITPKSRRQRKSKIAVEKTNEKSYFNLCSLLETHTKRNSSGTTILLRSKDTDTVAETSNRKKTPKRKIPLQQKFIEFETMNSEEHSENIVESSQEAFNYQIKKGLRKYKKKTVSEEKCSDLPNQQVENENETVKLERTEIPLDINEKSTIDLPEKDKVVCSKENVSCNTDIENSVVVINVNSEKNPNDIKKQSEVINNCSENIFDTLDCFLECSDDNSKNKIVCENTCASVDNNLTETCDPDETVEITLIENKKNDFVPRPTSLIGNINIDSLPMGFDTPKKNNLPSSPICEDTPDRNSELLSNTLDISPIKTKEVKHSHLNEVEEENDETIVEVEVAKDKTKDDNVNISDDNKSKIQTNVRSVISKCSPASEKCLIKQPSSRSAKLLNLIPNSPFLLKSSKSIIKKSCTTRISSPTTERIRKMMLNCGEKVKVPSVNYDDDVEIAENDVLTFKREVPSPMATPNSGILKRKAADIIDEGSYPSPKRKKVNFSDPPTSCKKIYFKEQEELKQNLKKSFKKISLKSGCKRTGNSDIFQSEESSCSFISGLSLVKAEPIYPQLINCDMNLNVLTSFSQNVELIQNFNSVDVRTIGDLAKLNDTQINQLEFLENPKLIGIMNALDAFYIMYSEGEYNHILTSDKKLNYENRSEDKTDLLAFDTDTSISKENPIFPELADCKDTIQHVLKWFETNKTAKDFRKRSITTIGHLAKLSRNDICKLHVKLPKVTYVVNALNRYHQKVLSKQMVAQQLEEELKEEMKPVTEATLCGQGVNNETEKHCQYEDAFIQEVVVSSENNPEMYENVCVIPIFDRKDSSTDLQEEKTNNCDEESKEKISTLKEPEIGNFFTKKYSRAELADYFKKQYNIEEIKEIYEDLGRIIIDSIIDEEI